MLRIKGANLIKSASFNKNQYSEVVKRNSIIAAFSLNEVKSSLPHCRSTALPSQSNIICLRAITISPLCFYDGDSTAKILAETLPDTLIPTELEEEKFEFTGPVLSQLRTQVNAGAKEEDNNLSREYLLKKSVQAQAALTGVPEAEIQATEPVHNNDMHFVIGLLKWMLVPGGKRTVSHYATRSPRVWATATAILQTLGFEPYRL